MGLFRAGRVLVALSALSCAPGPGAADLSGLGLPSDAARRPFGLPDTADPLGGLGRPRDALDDPIREDFDRPLFILGPDGRPRPADPVAPVAPERSPLPDARPGGVRDRVLPGARDRP